MPKKIAVEIDSRIIEKIRCHADGIGMDALHECFESAISRRSLQRRLAQFVAEGRIIREGRQRGVRYRLAPSTATIRNGPSPSSTEADGDGYIPISTEGKEIRALIRLPRHMRIPLGYNQGFLEAYFPNETAYLPEELRRQLHILGTPAEGARPAGTFAGNIMKRLLIDLSWASSRLEGNTYSRIDTEHLIEFGQAAEGKDALETQMILNHKAAIELLVNESDLVDFTPYTICSLHALLSDGLLEDQRSCGRIRNRPVEIGGSVYMPIAMPQRLDELFRVILSMAQEISDPFEQSFFVMVHLPYLQPFEDVNKRVSRLAANIPLIRHNLCPLSFIDVPERAYIDAMLGVYELNRIELLRDLFVWAYERSCQQYLAVRQMLVPPDTFRLRYRQTLTETVKTIILKRQTPDKQTIMAVISSRVPPEDQNAFVKLVLDEFAGLHEGNAIRFGIRPAEFWAWQKEING